MNTSHVIIQSLMQIHQWEQYKLFSIKEKKLMACFFIPDTDMLKLQLVSRRK